MESPKPTSPTHQLSRVASTPFTPTHTSSPPVTPKPASPPPPSRSNFASSSSSSSSPSSPVPSRPPPAFHKRMLSTPLFSNLSVQPPSSPTSNSSTNSDRSWISVPMWKQIGQDGTEKKRTLYMIRLILTRSAPVEYKKSSTDGYKLHWIGKSYREFVEFDATWRPAFSDDSIILPMPNTGFEMTNALRMKRQQGFQAYLFRLWETPELRSHLETFLDVEQQYWLTDTTGLQLPAISPPPSPTANTSSPFVSRAPPPPISPTTSSPVTRGPPLSPPPTRTPVSTSFSSTPKVTSPTSSTPSSLSTSADPWLSVPSWKYKCLDNKSRKKKTVYMVRVRLSQDAPAGTPRQSLNGRVAILWKLWQEFVDFDASWRPTCPRPQIALPSKHLGFKMKDEDKNKRQRDLNDYLQGMGTDKTLHTYLSTFLGVESKYWATEEAQSTSISSSISPPGTSPSNLPPSPPPLKSGITSGHGGGAGPYGHKRVASAAPFLSTMKFSPPSSPLASSSLRPSPSSPTSQSPPPLPALKKSPGPPPIPPSSPTSTIPPPTRGGPPKSPPPRGPPPFSAGAGAGGTGTGAPPLNVGGVPVPGRIPPRGGPPLHRRVVSTVL